MKNINKITLKRYYFIDIMNNIQSKYIFHNFSSAQDTLLIYFVEGRIHTSISRAQILSLLNQPCNLENQQFSGFYSTFSLL